MKRRLAIDWDGTCVENLYPDMGEWLEGAQDALLALQEHYELVIFSCRVARFEIDEKTKRPMSEVRGERNRIRKMLKQAGIKATVWTKDYKPPAVAYIDDRGIRFENNWKEITDSLVPLTVG